MGLSRQAVIDTGPARQGGQQPGSMAQSLSSSQEEGLHRAPAPAGGEHTAAILGGRHGPPRGAHQSQRQPLLPEPSACIPTPQGQKRPAIRPTTPAPSSRPAAPAIAMAWAQLRQCGGPGRPPRAGPPAPSGRRQTLGAGRRVGGRCRTERKKRGFGDGDLAIMAPSCHEKSAPALIQQAPAAIFYKHSMAVQAGRPSQDGTRPARVSTSRCAPA